MASASDRRAAVLLLALAAAGLAVRLVVGGGAAPGAVGYRFGAAGPTRDSVAREAARFARPLGPGERVDVDRASAAELERLPRIGPALAARIVADREAHGPFRSLDALRRVPGVGPTTVAALAPHVTYPTAPRPPALQDTSRLVAVNRATAEELTALPGIGPRLAAAIVADRQQHGPFRSPADLRRVRGIGPALVARLEGRIRIP